MRGFHVIIAGSLQIRHSQESDEGKYECVAENDAGVAYSYGANLYVRGKPVYCTESVGYPCMQWVYKVYMLIHVCIGVWSEGWGCRHV